jgi:hypothetical protein
LLLQILFAQNAAFRLLRSFPAQATYMRTDNLQNLYLVSSEGSIKKLGRDGDSIASYNSVRRYGSLFSIDVSNPLKVLLFYKDFAQVVVLDRFLAQQTALDLRRCGVQQPLAAALSFDAKIWVFDALSNKLKKMDENGKLLFETSDLRAVFPGGLQPQQIWDEDNWVYLYDSLQGLFVFDYYGNFKRKVPVAGWRNLVVSKQFIYGIKEGKLWRYNLSNLMQDEIALPASVASCSNIHFSPGRLVALCADEVRVLSQ